MEKLLTISIAAYNVQNYIDEALDKLTNSKYIDQLEIFIVDDGGQDDTLKIAQKYADRFPNSIIPVHKENGGYGSTVNYSLSKATGHYFKLLDGDDWFHTDHLDAWLEDLANTKADVVVTNFVKFYDDSNVEILKEYPDVEYGKLQRIQEMPMPLLGMWSLSYRTDLLHQIKLTLPEQLLYTDQIFATYPFAVAKTIEFMNHSVYYYRLGRDGQSVSRESRIKNIQQNITVFEQLLCFYEAHKTSQNASYILRRVSISYVNIFKTFLLLPTTKANLSALKDYDNRIKKDSYDIYQGACELGKAGKMINLFRKSYYNLFWLIKLLPKGFPNWE
ncbi:hypothetical protein CAC02_02180 [Streptococcus gallolyticus]|uniref:Glycosyltransferase 2-like domain-containing protein n=1 Tax=Streptococcus gallolyticus TaxID=315405 RepID=A0A368UF46_9STRE|nr:glycosyltransferase family A protein [Streptococcus gallolyticus]RCW17588.1 hypothetical protein CAC02_02180 [Streptococcus gallolyticus]